jgi:hypothetical protein
VQCQCILCSDVELAPHSCDNDLPPCLNMRYRELVLMTLKPMKLSEHGHNQLVDLVSLWEGLDCKEDYDDIESGESGSESGGSDMDESDADNYTTSCDEDSN